MRKYILTIFMSLLLVNSFVALTTYYEPIAAKYRYTTISLGKNLNQNFGEITSKTIIDQSFVGDSDNLMGARIFFSTFNRKNTGETTVQILDSDKKVLRTVKIYNKKLQDNAFEDLQFPVIKKSKGEVFFLRVTSPNDEANNAVTVWNDSIVSKNTKLFVNNKELEGTLVTELSYKNVWDVEKILTVNFVISLLNILTVRLFVFLRRR